MNGKHSIQLQLDFRTGLPTAIAGRIVSPEGREACTSLNRERTRGIKEATRPAAPGEPFEVDGWYAFVARKAAQWGVPLIPLSSLGLSFDKDGYFQSSILKRIGWGAEAIAWEDTDNGCVYKLFEVHPNSALGKRLQIEQDDDGNCRATHINADLDTTLEKLGVLHEAGACATEIVGLAASGDYLIVKQPLCIPSINYVEDRRIAAEAMHAIIPRFSLGREIRVFWLRHQPWCIGDLHENNVMRSIEGVPTIIDALICPLPPYLLRSANLLPSSIARAKALRKGEKPPSDDPFEGIPDEDF